MNKKNLTAPAEVSGSRPGGAAPQRKTQLSPLNEEMVAKELTE